MTDAKKERQEGGGNIDGPNAGPPDQDAQQGGDAQEGGQGDGGKGTKTGG